jgi:hypothetical protein
VCIIKNYKRITADADSSCRMAMRVLEYAHALCPTDMDLSRIYHLIEIDEVPILTRFAAGCVSSYRLVVTDTVELRILKLEAKMARLKVRAHASLWLITTCCSGSIENFSV